MRLHAILAGLGMLLATLPASFTGARAQGWTTMSPTPIGNSFLPLRFSVRLGGAGLSGRVSDFMSGGFFYGAELDVPLNTTWSVNMPINILHHAELRTPLVFPYTFDSTYAAGFAKAQGYANSVGLGLRWERHIDLERWTESPTVRLEPSLRGGLAREYVGWEPRLDPGGTVSNAYKQRYRFAQQAGWAPYAGAGLALVRYADADVPVLGVGLEYTYTRIATHGDELLPIGTDARGTMHALSLRLFLGTR